MGGFNNDRIRTSARENREARGRPRDGFRLDHRSCRQERPSGRLAGSDGPQNAESSHARSNLRRLGSSRLSPCCDLDRADGPERDRMAAGTGGRHLLSDAVLDPSGNAGREKIDRRMDMVPFRFGRKSMGDMSNE